MTTVPVPRFDLLDSGFGFLPSFDELRLQPDADTEPPGTEPPGTEPHCEEETVSVKNERSVALTVQENTEILLVELGPTNLRPWEGPSHGNDGRTQRGGKGDANPEEGQK